MKKLEKIRKFKLWENDEKIEKVRKFLYYQDSWLNKLETEFVRQSVIRKRQGEEALLSLVSIVVIVVTILAVWAWYKQREANIKSVEALRESAEANLSSNRQLEAALDILKAQKTLDSIDPTWGQILPEFRSSVQGTFFKLLYGTQERNRLQLDRGNLYEVVFNPNPQQDQLATVGKGDTVRLWNSKGDELAPLITEQKDVYSVAFRYDPKEPDSTVLATGGEDGTVKFWNIQENGSSTPSSIELKPKPKPSDSADATKIIDDVEFSADGELLAIVENELKNSRSRVKFWKLEKVKQGEQQKKISYILKDISSKPLGKENVYKDIAFSPKQLTIKNKKLSVLATVGEGDVVRLWNASGDKLGEINTQQGYAYSVAFNQDGILMTGGSDGTVKKWRIEPQDNTQSNPNQQVKFAPDAIKPIETKQENVYAVAVSPKGELATVGEDDVVKLWDNNSTFIHEKIQPLEGSLSDSKTRSVAFRPDGERLATIGGDNTIRLWDTAGKRIRHFGDVPEHMKNVVFSPDGRLMATVGTPQGEDNPQHKEKSILRLWDAGSGKEIDYVVASFNVKSLVFLPDPSPSKKQELPGQPIAAIKDDGTVYILFSDPKKNFRFAKEKHNETLIALEAGKFDQDYLSENKIERLTFSANLTDEAIIYTPNEKDKSKQLIQLRRSGNNQPVELRLENPGSIALSADGQRFAIARTDGLVQVWNIDKLFVNSNTFPDQPDIELQTQQGNIAELAFYPSDHDRLVTGGADGTVRLWDLSRNKPTQLPLLRDGELKTATASADGQRLATLSNEGILKLWDAEGGTLKASPLLVNQLNKSKQELKEAETIALSSTGKYIAIIEKDGSVLLWNTKKDNRVYFIPANQNDKAISIEFAPDDTRLVGLVAIRKSGRIEVWKLGEDGQLSQDLDKQANQPIPLLNTNRERLNNEQDIVSASFNSKNSSDLTTLYPDTTVLATLGKDGTVKLWNAKDERIGTFKTDQKEPHIIAFSPDGTRLATGATEGNTTEGTVRVWDTKGKQIRQFKVGLEDVKSITFSNDAQKLAVVAKGEKESSKENDNNQENFRVFDVNDESLQPINPSNTQQGTIANAMFTSDGQLATLSKNGRLILWQMSDFQLREGVCQLVWNYLNSNPTVKQDIGDLCGDVDEPMEQRFSVGEKLLIHSNPSPEKLAGIKAFANGDMDTAISNLDISLAPKRKDPEALIYLNNAQIRNRKSYTIAVSVPISSDTDGALEILRGVAQAQNKINQTGGINGAKLRILIADDKNDPEVAKQIAKELIKKPDVFGVVGHFTSDATLAASEIYNAEKLAAISPVSTSVKLSNKGQYTFRTVPSDAEAAMALADYMEKKFPQKKAVVFYNSESEYSNSLKNKFENSMAIRGRVLKKEDFFNLSDSSFDAVKSVTDLPEETVLVLMPNTKLLDKAIEVVQENAKREKPLPLLAGDDVYSPKILKEVKETETLKESKAEAAEAEVVDMVVAVPWHILPNPRTEFVQTSQWLWGGDVNWRTAMSYDATLALIEGLKQNPSREGVAQALRETRFTGATGEVQFSASGDRKEPKIQLVKIELGTRSSFGYDFVPVP